MRFLLDENTEHRIGRFLRGRGHDVTSIVADYVRGQDDRDILDIALTEQRILITNDRDFWDLAITQRRPHAGIVIFRLGKVSTFQEKLDHLNHLLTYHVDELDAVILILPDELHVQRVETFDRRP
jgi:predicted nuclease of predicted toxin-antitoxin system